MGVDITHKFKVGDVLFCTVKSLKYKDKPVKVEECKLTADDQKPYYMVTGEGIRGRLSVWEEELRCPNDKILIL